MFHVPCPLKGLGNFHDTNLLFVIYSVAPVNDVLDSAVICLALLPDVFAVVHSVTNLLYLEVIYGQIPDPEKIAQITVKITWVTSILKALWVILLAVLFCLQCCILLALLKQA